MVLALLVLWRWLLDYRPNTSNLPELISPSQTISALLQPTTTSANEECAICLEAFNDPMLLPCGHKFCDTCIPSTLNHSDSCPLDRQTLFAPLTGTKMDYRDRYARLARIVRADICACVAIFLALDGAVADARLHQAARYTRRSQPLHDACSIRQA